MSPATISRSALATRAEEFLAMHRGTAPLVLANAWDVASARLVEEAGFPAVATTSAGVAWSLGYRDGERISRREMLDAVARIASAVRVPVTADLEAAYGPTVEDAAATARGAIEAGAVGFNIEDGTRHPAKPLTELELQMDRIRAARAAADSQGVHLVINARTDVFLRGVGAPESRLGEAVRRLRGYQQAGADCLFAPGVSDSGTIGALIAQLNAPLNILARSDSPSIPELGQLGVARVSLGPGVMEAALGATRELLAQLRATGSVAAFLAPAMTYREVEEMIGGAERG
jgi:2-methylisocitrate lyase-like PEP mutase family enzyme